MDPVHDPDLLLARPDTRVALLSAEGVEKRFRDRPVLRAVDLSLAPGEVVSISGANGAGKTTLLRIVGGLLVADAGTVRLAGLEPKTDRRAYQRAVGLLSAGNAGLYGRLTVDHHLDLCGALALLPRAERRTAIERARDGFALGELQGVRVDRLSMGQRQRLRLALSFLHEPTLVLLDEPATSLDGDALALLDAELAALRRRGGAAVVCSPEREHGVRTDRALVMRDGRIHPA